MSLIRQVNIAIAGLRFQIDFDKGSLFLADRLCNTYVDWLTDAPPEFYVRILQVKKSIFQNNFPRQGTISKPLIEQDHNPQMKIICPDTAVAVSLTNNAAEIFTSNNNYDLAEQTISALLRNLASFWLMNRRCLLVHGCGVMSDERAVLFAGPSGSGKSTIATLADGRTVLNDETVALQYVRGVFVVSGTPWKGSAELCVSREARLNRIFFLHQSNQNSYVKLRLQEAYVLLIKNIFPPFGHESFLPAMADLCLDIAEGVPCYRFNFVPNATIWECIDLISDRESDEIIVEGHCKC